MKKLLIIGFCLFTTLWLYGQATSVVAAEYFFDSDPGAGNAVSLAVSLPDDMVTVTGSISTAGLPSGFHILYIRSKDDLGKWSLTEGRILFIYGNPPAPSTGASQIVKAEYFIDSDPGVNNGTGIPVNPGSSVNISIGLPTTDYQPGFHHLYIRTKDDLGKWTLTEGRIFYIYANPPAPPTGASQIVKAEYFIDTDPGVNNGTDIPNLTPEAQVVVSTALLSGDNPLGVHNLYIRTQDNLGKWSLAEPRSFTLTCPSISISGGTDICQHSSVTLSVTVPGNALSCNLQWEESMDGNNFTPVSGANALTYDAMPSATMYYRAIYDCSLSGCSLTSNVEVIHVTPSITYYADADGDHFGNPSATVQGCSLPSGYVSNSTDCDDSNMSIHPGASEVCNGKDDNCDGNIDEGLLTLFYQDSDGDQYGDITNTIMACSAPNGFVSNHTDCDDTNPMIHPGATEICGNLKDDNCDGGIDNTQPPAVIQPLSISICNGDITTLSASGGTNYLWSTGETTDVIHVNPTATTTYSVSVTESATQCSAVASSTVTVLPIPNGGLPATTVSCGGSPLTLTAAGGTAYQWSTNETTPNITVMPSMSTTYTVTITNNYGCSTVTSVAVSVTNTAPVLSFVGTGNFVSHVVDPLTASTYAPFHFEVMYTDVDGDLPLGSYPRVLLDYEGDGSFAGANDRLFIMHEEDPLDIDVTDGKLYYYTAYGLPVGANYKTTIQATDVNNCSTSIGPFNEPDVLNDADISIFANDIQFSNPHPNPNQVITVSATIHNESDFGASNFVVHMVNQNTGEIFSNIAVPSLSAHATTTVSWTITTPPMPSWNPMQVFIDYTNVITEPNELDNQAIRPFINGDFNLPGDIGVTASVSPQTSYTGTGNSLSICGNAIYENTAVPLMDPSVAGATVTITLIETGATYSTYTNSYGNYCYSFLAPVTPGLYHLSVEVTDYTLTGGTTTQFVLIPPPPGQTDISCELSVSTNNIFPGESVTGSLIVRNTGAQNVLVPSLVTVELPEGTPVPGSFVVPPLNAGATYSINLPSMTFPNVGTTYLRTNIDATNVILESNESNNSCLQYISVCSPVPDIYALANVLYGPYYQCASYNYNFAIYNIGCVPTGAFSAQVTVYNHTTGITTTFPFSMTGIGANSNAYVNVPFNYPNSGNYTFTLNTDLGNVVNELSETNNSWSQTIAVYLCSANLSVADCQLHVDPVNPAGTMTVSATVSNSGNAPVNTDFDVTFQVQGNMYTATVGAGLGAGQSTNVVVNNVPVPNNPGSDLFVTVDPSDVVPETNEFDNTANGPLCYDFQPVRLCYAIMFWDYPRVVNQPVSFFIGLRNNGLFNAVPGVVNFKVSGPGLMGTINLGNATISQAYSTLCSCPMTLTLPTLFAFPQTGTYHVVMTADPDHVYTECNENNNVLEVDVIVTNLPDYRILSQHIAPSKLNPDVGEPITIDVTYENIGNDGTSDSLNIKVLVDEVALDSVRDRGLASGDHWTVEMPQTWSSTLPGTHIIRAIADSRHEINEGNEINNEATRAVIVGQSPNLFFHSFDASEPAGGQAFQYSTFTSDIGNDGDLACNAFLQYFYINDNGDTTYIGQQPIGVPANNHIVVTYSWLVFDNSTKIIAKIVNASPEESRYDDNLDSDIIGSFTVDFTKTPETCIGYMNGNASARVTGGQGPYQYEWSNGASGPGITAGAGIYSVVITDAIGNTGIYGVAIEVSPDNSNPLIYNVPSSITHFANDGVCPAIIHWVEPLATDNCGVANFISNHLPGEGFPVGTTTVIYTATDAAGNSASATFNVTVIGVPLVYAGADNIVCSSDAILNAANPGVGIGAWSTLSTTAVVSDPGNMITQVTNLSPGANIFIWSVNNGTCNSGVDTVVIFNNHSTISCPAGPVIATTTTQCSVVVTYNVTATGTPPPNFTYTVSGGLPMNGTGSGSTFNVGTSQVSITATNNCETSTCSFNVVVNDQTPPTALCHDVTVQLNANHLYSITASEINNGSSDNCGTTTLMITGGKTSYDCSDAGHNYTLTLTATDSHSNTAICNAQVTVSASLNPCCTSSSLSCTSPLNINTNPGTCSATVTNTQLLSSVSAGGLPSPEVTFIPAAGSFTGNTTVQATAINGCGAPVSCTFMVHVVDNQSPSITCPPNITVTSGATTCNGAAIVAVPASSDNCSGVTLMNSFNNSGNASGSYPVGTTTVVWTATDVGGNRSTCMMTVKVVDNRIPNITCPANLTHTAGTISDLPIPTMSDNCGINHYEGRYKSGASWSAWKSQYNLTGPSPLNSPPNYVPGTYTMQYQAIDNSSNLKVCQFALTITASLASQIPDGPLASLEPQRVEIKESDGFSVFPNPASGEVYLLLDNDAGKSAAVQLINSQGVIVHQKRISNIPDSPIAISVIPYPPGMYWLKVKVDGKRSHAVKLAIITE